MKKTILILLISCIILASLVYARGDTNAQKAVMASDQNLSVDERIDRINDLIDSQNKQWTAGETSMSHLTLEQKKAMLLPSKIKMPKDARLMQASLSGSYPSTIDWRDRNGDWTTPIKNQGSCGSCWAFAANAVVESRVNIALNNSGYDMDLSEQYLLSCSGGGSCSGGESAPALSFMQSDGITREACFAYTATNGTCSDRCSDYSSQLVKVLSYSMVSSPDTIKQALNDYGPVTVYMAVYEDFGDYTSGVYSWTYGDFVSYHAVSIVGYDDSNQYWICKNSWGTGWGENGIFKIDYSENVLDSSSWTYTDLGEFFTDESYVVTSTDIDNDNIADQSDNCPFNANPSQTNTDGDSQGDICDTDDDNDGIADTSDLCPLVIGIAYYNGCPDIYAPDLLSTLPVNNSYTNDSTPGIYANFSDATGINTALVILKVDDVDKTSGTIITSSNVEYLPITALSEGLHHVDLTLVDTLSNSKTYTWFFTIDTIYPNILNQAPANGSVTYDLDNVQFTVNYTELNLDYVELHWNTSIDGWHTNVLTCNSGINKQCSAVLNLSSYPYETFVWYYFNVFDKTGQITYLLPYSFQLKCMPEWALNSTWSACNLADYQYKNYYDANFCPDMPTPPSMINQTCNYCSPIPLNASWIDWVNQTACLTDDTFIQNRSRVEYDSNKEACFDVTQLGSDLLNNQTHWDFQAISCDYCQFLPANSSWSEWQDQTVCAINDTRIQNRSKTEYDINYGECYAVTGMELDLWNNQSYWDYQTVSCDYCVPNAYEINTSCRANDTRIGWYNDSNACYSQTGLVSDKIILSNNTYSCDYCTPSWQCSNYTCLSTDRQQCNQASDANNCYAQTGLSNDQYSGDVIELSSGYCDYDNNNIIGNVSEISTTLDELSVSIDNSTDLTQMFNETSKVEFIEGNETIIEFDYDFAADKLNLANISIETQNDTASRGYIRITGIDLALQNATKTAYMDHIDASANRICILDKEIASIAEISGGCTGTGETSLVCDGAQNGNHKCTLNGSKYTIEGLSHSGAVEYIYVAGTIYSGGGGGGGGGGFYKPKNATINQTVACSKEVVCGEWMPCKGEAQTRTCKNGCGEMITDVQACTLGNRNPQMRVMNESRVVNALVDKISEQAETGIDAITGATVFISRTRLNALLGIGILTAIIIGGILGYTYLKQKNR